MENNTHQAMISDDTVSVHTDDTMFDNQIQALMTASRPTSSDNDDDDSKILQFYSNILDPIFDSCMSSDHRWKRALLSLIHKRYHILSPEAKKNQEEGGGGASSSVGDGERRIFYLAIRRLVECSIAMMTTDEDEEDNGRKNKKRDEYNRALDVLIKVAPLCGGSRDLCAIMETMLAFIVYENKQKAPTGTSSLSMSTGRNLTFVEAQFQQSKDGSCGPYSILEELIQQVAETLDQDLDMIGRVASHKEEDGEKKKQQQLPSTLHVFLPHHERGRPSKKKRKNSNKGDEVMPRLVSNALLEILIWDRTERGRSHKVFQGALNKLRESVSKYDNEAAKASIATLQAIARKQFRRPLSQYARSNGFLLSNQFVMDSSQLSYSQIQHGKSGDLNKVLHLARKKNEATVLRMINLRFASNPSKITKFDSIRQLLSSWVVRTDTDNEMEVLEHQLLLARFKATVNYLQGFMEQNDKDGDSRQIVIASMESSKENHVAAVLVGAAAAATASSWGRDEGDGDNDRVTDSVADATIPKLFLSGVERSLGSLEDCENLINEIIRGETKNEMDIETFTEDGGSGLATPKAIKNLLDRHVNDHGTLILLTSASVELPGDLMEETVQRGCRIHCHDTDCTGERLKREKASAGDVTVTLTWDTVDDLDLHVFVPDGSEVFYGNTEAMDGRCVLDVDMNAGTPFSTEPVENVFLGDLDKKIEAPHGTYKVMVQNYAYHSKQKGPIPFQIVINMNGKKQKHEGVCEGRSNGSNVVVCEFDYAGRTIPFPGKEKEMPDAYGSSNLVNITSSSGQTLESLSNLVQAASLQSQLEEVVQLTIGEEAVQTPPTADEESDAPEEAVQLTIGEEEVQTPPTADEESDAVMHHPVITTADHGKLEVTNRDRHTILLAKLPRRFHAIVSEAYGGGLTLTEECAVGVAKRMLENKIPISELKRAGYPSDIIEAVEENLLAAAVSS